MTQTDWAKNPWFLSKWTAGMDSDTLNRETFIYQFRHSFSQVLVHSFYMIYNLFPPIELIIMILIFNMLTWIPFLRGGWGHMPTYQDLTVELKRDNNSQRIEIFF